MSLSCVKHKLSPCGLQPGREATDMKVTDNVGICAIRWMDNGMVTLASCFTGKNEVDKKNDGRKEQKSTQWRIVPAACVQS